MERTPRQDKTFGRLTWDDTLDYWAGQVNIPGIGLVRISVDAEDDEDITPDDAFANARRAFLAFRDKEITARDFAAEALLDVYNREWNAGQPPMDEDTFIDRLALADISFAPDGSVELFYNAGDLFQGHTIIVHLDEDGAFDDVEFAG